MNQSFNLDDRGECGIPDSCVGAGGSCLDRVHNIKTNDFGYQGRALLAAGGSFFVEGCGCEPRSGEQCHGRIGNFSRNKMLPGASYVVELCAAGENLAQ